MDIAEGVGAERRKKQEGKEAALGRAGKEKDKMAWNIEFAPVVTEAGVVAEEVGGNLLVLGDMYDPAAVLPRKKVGIVGVVEVVAAARSC